MKKIIILYFLLIILFSPILVFAGETNERCSDKDCVSLDNPLPANTTVPSLIGTIIKSLMGIIGALALVMFIFGGFTWMTAAGNSERVKKGKDILVWAVIGMIVIFAAYAAVHFIITSI